MFERRYIKVGLLNNFGSDAKTIKCGKFEIRRFSNRELESLFLGENDDRLPADVAVELTEFEGRFFIVHEFAYNLIVDYFLLPEGQYGIETPINILNLFKRASSPVQLERTYSKPSERFLSHTQISKRVYRETTFEHFSNPQTEEIREFPSEGFRLDRAEKERFRYFHNAFLQLAQSERKGKQRKRDHTFQSIMTALYFFSKGDIFYFNYPWIEPLINYVSALEALLSEGSQDIRFKISMRCSMLLGQDEEIPAEQILQFIKGVYLLRSKIVHGALSLSEIFYLKESKKIPDIRMVERSLELEPYEYLINLRECLRRSILNILGLYLSGFGKKSEIINFLDICAVSPASRTELSEKKEAWKQFVTPAE